MKIVNKIIIAIFCMIIITCLYSLKVYAADDSVQVADLSLQTILNKADNFKDHGNNQVKITIDTAESELLPLGTILVVAGNITVVIVAAVMGIKWITASPEQQSKLKQQMIGFVVSIVVIYGAVGIWMFARNVMDVF